MITLQKISKSFGARILFEGVDLSFKEGNCYGLTGPNGAGKSTLLKMIMGMEEPTTGQVVLPEKVGILRQNIEDYADIMVRDCVIMGNDRLWKTLEERDRLYEGEMTDEVGMRLGELEEIVADEDGYSADANAEELLSGMGIPEECFERQMSEIPTDFQFRVLLCQALFGEPQALLLDEPTNHLDLDSIGWLENFLGEYRGVLIVVSHDRHFLNTVCTHIADIDYETVILYPGNYDAMIVAKSSVRARAEAEAKSKEKKVAQLKEFVQRFGAGSRASQVQSRVREMNKLKPQELKKSNIERPYIRFNNTEKPPGKIVMKLEGVSKQYEADEPVITNFSIEIERGDKVGVIGANGMGKSTLLKLIAGAHEPDEGVVEPGHGVEIGYFPQNHNDLIDKTTVEDNAFDWLKSTGNKIYDQDVRGVMGKMLFGGDDAFKMVRSLSGGETARLIMAQMMLTEHNVIILDEPNNHLDLEAVSALAWAIEEFSGTVIVAGHDRSLMEQVATKIIAFEDDGIHVYNGTLPEYMEKRAAKV